MTRLWVGLFVTAVDERSIRDTFPESWRSPWLFGLERWQWLAIPTLGVVIALLTAVLARLTAMVVRRLRRGKASPNALLTQLDKPLRLLWAALLFRFALPFLELAGTTEALWNRIFRAALGAAVVWATLRAITLWTERFGASALAQSPPGSRALFSLLARIARLSLWGVTALAVLSELGYSVSSVLTGLGIGGIALALGAQKTLENVFGAFALAVDQPIREGDFVRVDDVLATVERIGLRSTRLRTPDRTVVSIPNGKLSDMRLETFAARDRLRFQTIVRLHTDTTAEQLTQSMEGFRQALLAQPQLTPQSASVYFVKLGESALEIEVLATFDTTDDDVFKRVRQDVLLRFLATVEAAGTRFAYPPQTVQLMNQR